MKNILLIFLFLLLTNISLASDDKPGRFFEDQPDVNDDYKFTMHASGKVMGKADVIKWAMSGDINKDKVRVLFENDEIGVEHSFVTFNDGNKEAVMAVYKYKDGKVVSLETGATKIAK